MRKISIEIIEKTGSRIISAVDDDGQVITCVGDMQEGSTKPVAFTSMLLDDDTPQTATVKNWGVAWAGLGFHFGLPIGDLVGKASFPDTD